MKQRRYVKSTRISHRLWFQLLLSSFAMIPATTHAQATEAMATGNDTLVFVSDTQAPLFVERLIHRTPFNRTATGLIFDDILRKQPQIVFLLGDVVAAGSKPARWTGVDHFLDSMRKDGSQVWACLGNHEYLYNARSGVNAFQKRFPQHNKTGYYIIKDSVAILLLNSNFSRLSTAEQEQQARFYTRTLAALDHNDSVKVIIVACHHAPYSNSKVVGSNLKVRTLFAAPFIKTAKGMLFLSGHSHNFEHFKTGGKTFLVIGGGGGIRQRLNTGAGRIECEDDDCHPAFHYLMVKRNADTLLVTCRALKDDLSGFGNILSFTVYAAQAPHQ
ncbi:metallophosphoesterase family protein [Taibaiella koreensis]|uniref:metallophosphoesterase family protein n=1 Tax=Taibaiella koreensis TaxID=1268548 RepID=UPI000E59EF8E|nr:metallophosphoesterase [Taibaiella koreensis]